MNRQSEQSPRHIPRLGGADIELANYIVGVDNRGRSTGDEASRLLLAEVPGVLAISRDDKDHDKDRPEGKRSSHDFGAHGRKFLPCNGGSAYIDLDHFELCLPEVIGVRDHLAAYHAMLRIGRRALVRANRRLAHAGSSRRVEVLVNNSDGHGASYGSHLDMAITRNGFSDLFRKPGLLGGLASYQASSIAFSGQGKVGAEDGAEDVEFQLSQRADFLCTLLGQQTTFYRPIVNTRDEALCGRRGSEANSNMARLHVIFYDSNLCHVAHFLKVGVLQIIITMIEAGAVPAGLVLDDPVEAAISWSHDPTLRETAELVAGNAVTCVEHQWMWFDAAERFLSQGLHEAFIPDLDELLELWGKTLQRLEAAAASGDFEPLSGDLDWVLKQRCLQMAIDNHAGLSWESPEIKQLDHCYSNLDLDNGLYWNYERSGIVNRLVTDEEIKRFEVSPPLNTRAWTRAQLLRVAEAEIDYIDWDKICFRSPGSFRRRFTLSMDDPFSLGRDQAESLLEQARSTNEVVDELSAASDSFSRQPPFAPRK